MDQLEVILSERVRVNTGIVFLPCMPETISTTSSYTIRVAVRSGSKSRLMEENTGVHRKNTHKGISPIDNEITSKLQIHLLL